MRNPSDHLTIEEFVAFVTEDLPRDEEAAVDRHMDRCSSCARQLEAYYEAEAGFPEAEWEARKAAFETGLRRRLVALGGPIDVAARPASGPSFVVVAAGPSLRSRLAADLKGTVLAPRLAIPQGLAAASRLTDLRAGQTRDGLLRWNPVPEESGGVTLHIGSHELGLEGARLRFYTEPARPGDWEAELVLRRVAPDQVGGRVVITNDDRFRRMADDACIHAELIHVPETPGSEP